MANNYKERLLTHNNILRKMIEQNTELMVIQRELSKFVQFGTDDYYSIEERIGVTETLRSIANGDKVNKQQRALILANAYKLDQINGLGLDVPVERLDETLYIDNEWRELPASLLKDMPEEEKHKTELYKANAKLDEGILDKYNIGIAVWRFNKNPYYEMFRHYGPEIDGE